MSFSRRDFLQAAAAAVGVAACADGPRQACDEQKLGACAAPGLPAGAYFSQLATDLDAASVGTPQLVIDLDRLDWNIDAISSRVGPGRLRIVEKSLPSLDLLDYIRARSGAARFMVLHLPFLPDILRAFPNADFLIGKPQPTPAVAQLLRTYTPAERTALTAQVRFLADTRARAEELLALATELDLTLQIAVELDVGLHRGGVRRPRELGHVLDVFVQQPERLRFAGFLGYDGHVTSAPAASGAEADAARATHRSATAAYQAFVNVLTADYPSLWRDDLIFDSGGSSTYPLYDSGPVNDVAVGGGFLRPASYSSMFIGDLRPALFLATPVLATFDKVDLPFLGPISETFYDDQQGFSIYGGGWAANFVWPEGVSLAPFVSDSENLNLVPNQSWALAPEQPKLKPGDWIFQHPKMADAIFQFEQILLVRDGRLATVRWRAFPRRY